MSQPVLRIIVGSTASGKERLALACASRIGAEIVSVDSMKVYRGLDIATAKAGAEERTRVRHHCLDLVAPTDTFSAADFVAAAERAIADIVSRGRVPLLSGGTALYYRALLEGLFDGPGAEPEVRARLEARAAEVGGEVLHRELAGIDPEAAAKIHPADIRRLVRALEVTTLTGQGISLRQTQWKDFHAPAAAGQPAELFATPRYPFTMVRLVRSRADVHDRIRRRIERMAAAGLEAEARMVWRHRDRIARTPLQAVGYKELFPFFDGQASWTECLERLRHATNRLVRRQETWFRKFPARDLVVPPDADPEDVASAVVAAFL
ncbi:MAG: tRNA (adenosine(37)-N6)-dimethylallyltransferase MiaA [Planctomycetes bacterium]|nr:tRNA (adenosine(37)-N6)-dimethylallyltransferase MiaA [Planctomycetota bacterium]